MRMNDTSCRVNLCRVTGYPFSGVQKGRREDNFRHSFCIFLSLRTDEAFRLWCARVKKGRWVYLNWADGSPTLQNWGRFPFLHFHHFIHICQCMNPLDARNTYRCTCIHWKTAAYKVEGDRGVWWWSVMVDCNGEVWWWSVMVEGDSNGLEAHTIVSHQLIFHWSAYFSVRKYV